MGLHLARHLAQHLAGHLARGKLINLVDAMRARVRRWESVGAAEPAMNNSIRAFASLPVRVEPL